MCCRASQSTRLCSPTNDGPNRLRLRGLWRRRPAGPGRRGWSWWPAAAGGGCSDCRWADWRADARAAAYQPLKTPRLIHLSSPRLRRGVLVEWPGTPNHRSCGRKSPHLQWPTAAAAATCNGHGRCCLPSVLCPSGRRLSCLASGTSASASLRLQSKRGLFRAGAAGAPRGPAGDVRAGRVG